MKEIGINFMTKLNIIERYSEVDDCYQFDELGRLFNVNTNRKVGKIDSGTSSYSRRCSLKKKNGISSSFTENEIRKAISYYLLYNK